MKQFFFSFFLLSTFVAFGQNKWTQKVSFSSANLRFCPFSFSINGYGYIGGGYDGSVSHTDFFKYDPLSNTWSQAANIVGARHNAFSFVINGKAYVGGGRKDNGSPQSDFQEYNPVTNKWTFVSSMPVGVIAGEFFEVGGYGYVIGGWDGTLNRSDVYKYDPVNDSWTTMSSIPFSPRTTGVSFTIGNTGYVGLGFDGTTLYDDFYAYNPDSDTWHQIPSYPVGGTNGAQAFVIDGKVYVEGGTNNTNDRLNMYMYDPILNSWTARANYGGTAHRHGMSFSIGSRGYSGGGLNGSNYYNGMYMYETVARSITSDSLRGSVYCKADQDTAYFSVKNIYNSGNKFNIYASNDGFTNKFLIGSVSAQNEGEYSALCDFSTISALSPNDSFQFRVESTQPVIIGSVSKSFVIHSPKGRLTATRDTFCTGDSSSVILYGRNSGTNFTWNINGAPQNITDTVVTAKSAGSYVVTLTDLYGCQIDLKYNVYTNPTPDATIFTLRDTACDGDSIFLKSMNNSTGETFQWLYNGNVFAGNANSIYAKGSGNYQLLKRNQFGCSAKSAIKSIEILALPKPELYLLKDTICLGDSIVLASVNNGAGISNSWYFNGVENAGWKGQSLVYIKQSGIYKLEQSNSYGCLARSTDKALTTLSVSKPSVIRVGKSLVSSSANTYQWFMNGAAMNGETKQYLDPTSAGIYTVRVYNSFGCFAESDTISFNALNGVSSLSSANSGFVIYPNPAGEKLNIIINNSNVSTIYLIDMKGMVVKNFTLKGQTNFDIDLGDLGSGLYLIVVEGKEILQSQKVLIQK